MQRKKETTRASGVCWEMMTDRERREEVLREGSVDVSREGRVEDVSVDKRAVGASVDERAVETSMEMGSVETSVDKKAEATSMERIAATSFIWSKKTLSLRIFLAGGIAGAVSRTVTAPLDRIKVLMQASHGKDALRFVSSMKKIYASSGVRGFWRGNGVNCIKLFPETAIRFYVYEFLRAGLNIDTHHADVMTRFVTGSVAGLVSQTVIYPLEVIKTRIALSEPGLYSGMWDVVKTTVRREGAG